MHSKVPRVLWHPCGKYCALNSTAKYLCVAQARYRVHGKVLCCCAHRRYCAVHRRYRPPCAGTRGLRGTFTCVCKQVKVGRGWVWGEVLWCWRHTEGTVVL